MAVQVHIHKVYRSFTNGLVSVEVEGHTVGECLDNLVMRYPDMKRVLFTTNGDLLKNIDLYVNRESAYPKELKTLVSQGDDIYVHLLITGG